jgi:PAS domain S-box-containing protein
MAATLSPGCTSKVIRRRLVLGNIVIGLMLLVTGGIAMLQVNRLASAVGVLQVASQRATIALQVHQRSTQMIGTISRLLPVEDPVAFETLVAEELDGLKECHAALEALTQETRDDEEAYLLMQRVGQRIDSVIGIAETMVRQAGAGQWPSVRVRVGVLTRDHQQLARETNQLVELAVRMQETAAEQVAFARLAALVYPSLGVLLSLAIGTLLTLRTTRSIARPVEQLTEGAAHLAAGSLDKRVSVESADELGALAAAFNRMADRLQASHAELERRVAERTADLHRRALQLHAAAEVARSATCAGDLDNLLHSAVDMIQDRFGFYHAGIFLVDERREYAVLRAATGEAGNRMLARRHRLKVGEVGIVGFVAGTGQPRIALDVGEDACFFDNPDLPETRSELALPLRVGERVIGALDVQSRQAAAFDESDVTILQTMADQLAMAIENARLVHEMQMAIRELAEERNLLNATLDALPDLLFEVDREGRIFDCRTPHQEMLDRSPEGFIGRRLDEVLPQEVAGVISESLEQAAESETGRTSGAIYPLTTRRGPGWFELSIAPKTDRSVPGARFIVLARDVTQRVEAEEGLRRRNRELGFLNRVSQTLTSTLNLDHVLGTILEEARRMLGAIAGSVWLVDPETNDVVCHHATGAKRDLVEGWHLQLGEGIVGWVALHGESALVADTHSDERYFDGVDAETGLKLHSILSVPLRVQRGVIGVLQVLDTRAGRFGANDLMLLESLAAPAAVAVDNARLVEALRQHALELESSNEELDAFAHSVAHDLKNPLGPVVGLAEVLRLEYDTLPEEELQRCLSVIAQNGRKMSNIIDELLLLAGVRKMDVQMVPLDIAHIVGEALRRVGYMVEEHRAQISMPGTWPAAQGYPPWVEEVWVNYISNAIQYGGRPPRLELGAVSLPEGMARFWVRDNGPGLTEEEQSRLFTPFTRLDHVQAKGHGLGLSIVRRIVEKLGGQVGVRSEVGVGSVFWFTLPGPESQGED